MKKKEAVAVKYSPWMVSAFPEQLRRDFVALCTRQGVSVGARLEGIIREVLKKEAK